MVDVDKSIPLERPAISARTRVVGVIGHPVRHSLSPVIHNAGFRSTGSDFVYVAFDVAPGSARAALDAMRVLELAGLSVTMPHKADVAHLVDELAPSARLLESVNTVQIADDGRLIGHSTDGDGLISSLAHRGISVVGSSVAILGAGAAARSVIDALVRQDVTNIGIINRTFSSAVRAMELAPETARAVAIDDEGAVREALESSDIVINATSIGMGASSQGNLDPSDMPIPISYLTSDHVVVDLVYHPIFTPFLRAAEAAGCTTVDGLGMLVHQAALQQEIWTGAVPDVALMKSAAEQVLQTPQSRQIA